MALARGFEHTNAYPAVCLTYAESPAQQNIGAKRRKIRSIQV